MSTKRAGDRAPGAGKRSRRGRSKRTESARDAEHWGRVWRELRRRGLVTTAGPVKRPPENPEFRPIRVEGEPLSETIIRERGARLDIDKIAKALRATRRGRIEATGGYFGAAGIVAEARARFRTPARGGRATDPAWTAQRLVRLKPATLARLERMAAKLRRRAGVPIEPMQLAALLLERATAGEPDESHPAAHGPGRGGA